MCLANTAKAELLEWNSDLSAINNWTDVSFTGSTQNITAMDTLNGAVNVDNVTSSVTFTFDASKNYDLVRLVFINVGPGTIGGIKVNGADTDPVQFAAKSGSPIDAVFYGQSEDPITSLSFYAYAQFSGIIVGFANSQAAGDENDGDDDDTTTPKPATMFIIGLGVAGLGLARRRMSK